MLGTHSIWQSLKKILLLAIFPCVYLADSELRVSLGETSFSSDSIATMKVLPSNIGKKSEVTDPSDPLQTLVLQFEMYSTLCRKAVYR